MAAQFQSCVSSLSNRDLWFHLHTDPPPFCCWKRLKIPPCVFEKLFPDFAGLTFSSTSNNVTGSPRHHFYLWFLLFLLLSGILWEPKPHFSQLFLAGPIRMAGLHTSPRLMRKDVLVCSRKFYFHSWNPPGVSLQIVRYIAHPKSGWASLSSERPRTHANLKVFDVPCVCVNVHWLLVKPCLCKVTPVTRSPPPALWESSPSLPGWPHWCVAWRLLAQDTPQTYKKVCFRHTGKAKIDPKVCLCNSLLQCLR